MKILLLHAFPLDPSMWDAQAPVLEGHEVDRPSIYGRGNTMDAWAASLHGELDGPYDVCVGASMGGGCALALERQRPGFLGAVVLAGAHAGPDAHERRPLREEQIAEYRAEGDDEKLAIVEALRDRPDDRAVVAGFPGPLLVAVGEGDEMISEDAGRRLAGSAPQGRFELVPGAGHLVSVERADEFNRILAAFLEEVA